MGGGGASKYLATERDLHNLTAEQQVLRSQLKEAIEMVPVRAGCARCFHSSDMLGGFSIVAEGLRPSTKVNQQLGRMNLDVSPLQFGFPAQGWLERLLNNNYGKAVEGTSSQPDNAWVVKRGQVCVVVDIPERLLTDARDTDRNYKKEGRDVHYIPQVMFDSFDQEVFPRRNIVYAFRTTLEEPSSNTACILAERFGEAVAKQSLFDIRWLLELGAPIVSEQLTKVKSLLRECDPHNIAALLARKAKKAVQALSPHLSSRDIEEVERVVLGGHSCLWLQDVWSGNPEDAAALLMEVLAPNLSSLSNFHCSHCCIGPEGAAVLAEEALKRNITLQLLSLGYNGIYDKGASALARWLEHNSTLDQLGLEGNGIGDAGASALAKALEQNSSLRTLHLFGNRIGPQGTSALASALERNRSLRDLDLSHNLVGPEGALALERALGHNSSLEFLYLASNSIGAEGASALGEALGHNSSLRRLDLQRNNISAEGPALRQVFEHMPRIQL